MALKPKNLKQFLAPFKLLTNRNALSLTYKTLELTPDLIRGTSNFGILEVRCSLGIDSVMHVDATTFMMVIDSLPPDEDLDLIHMDGAMAWGCGTASGKLALVALDSLPAIERSPAASSWPTNAMFAAALRQGAMSCDNSTLASVGMHGVAIYNRDGNLSIATSDNVTVACAMLPGTTITKAPDLVTIAPEAAALLAAVIDTEGTLAIDKTSLFYSDANTKLLLKQVAPLKVDLLALMGNFSDDDLVAPLPSDRVQFFIRRVMALSETKQNLHVTLLAEDGKLAISFSETLAGTDEFFLVEGLKLPEGLEIKLDAVKLARALSHVDEIVLDHLGKSAALFRGSEPAFFYLVSGRA